MGFLRIYLTSEHSLKVFQIQKGAALVLIFLGLKSGAHFAKSQSGIPKYVSYRQYLVHGEGTSLSRLGPVLQWRHLGQTFVRVSCWVWVGPYQFCMATATVTILSILHWSYLMPLQET